MAKKNLKIPKKKKSKRNHIIASHFIIKGGGDKDIKSYIGKLVLLATPKKPKP